MNELQAPAQLTMRAIVLAVVLAVVLAAANTYLGLFAGLTIASAIPAAVVSMAVLRVLGGSTIFENNIVQTGASAGSSIASGVIFTIPALLLLGYWDEFKYLWVLSIAGLGGILGVFFSVPLRRSLIVEQNLKFPEGIAAAEVLKAGDNPGRGVKLLGLAALGGGLAKLAAGSGLRMIPDTAAGGTFIGKWLAYFGTNLSPALLGVGYIVGLNIGALALAGGMISWNIAIPIYAAYFLADNTQLAQTLAGADAVTVANEIWAAQVRYLGVGAMLVGGVWALISIRSSLVSGIRSGLRATRAGAAKIVTHTEQDLPMQAILIGLVLFTIPLAILYQMIVHNLAVSLLMTIIMVVAGFVFTSVSAYMAGLVGSSNNPVSGITICTILFASLLLLVLMGKGAAIGPVAAIMIGSVVCCAACIGGDNLQDLKAGYLIGATPWRQQVMLAIGAASCALIMAPVLNLLSHAYGIGVRSAEHPNALIAPQATLMASVAKGMFGGHLPWGMITIGGLIGTGIILFDIYLKRRKAPFQAPVLAVAVGIYLPLDLSVPIFIGGLLAWLVERRLGVSGDTPDGERAKRNGILFAAGLITGEALTGIVIAIPIVMSGRADVLALPASLQFGGLVGLAVVGALSVWLYRVGINRDVNEPSAAPSGAGRMGVVWNHARRRENLPYLIAFAIIYLSWGSTFLAMRIGVTHLPPLIFSAGRSLLAGVLLLLLAMHRGERLPKTSREYAFLAFFGIAMITLPNGASAFALTRLHSNEVALLNTSLAFWIVMLGTLGPMGQQLRRRSVVGLLLGFCGVAMIVWPHGTGYTSRIGWQALALLGCFVWSVGHRGVSEHAAGNRAHRLQRVHHADRGHGLARRRRGEWRTAAVALGAARHVRVAVPRGGRLGARLHGIRVAVEERAHGSRRNLRLREPCDRDVAGLARARRNADTAANRRHAGRVDECRVDDAADALRRRVSARCQHRLCSTTVLAVAHRFFRVFLSCSARSHSQCPPVFPCVLVVFYYKPLTSHSSGTRSPRVFRKTRCKHVHVPLALGVLPRDGLAEHTRRPACHR